MNLKKILYSIGIISIPYILFLNVCCPGKSYNEPEVTRESVVKPWYPDDKKKDLTAFKKAFKKARAKYGPNDRFRWRGNWYHTNYVEEMEEN
jgi:hypothetical protein